MKTQEAQALITAAQIYLRRYKGANAALKEAKAALEEYMDGAGIENVDGVEPGSGARFVSRADRQLALDQMDDDTIIWCARNNVLKGTIGAFDELPDEQRATLQQYIGRGAGTRYVDLYFPPYGTAAQAKKETARANSTAAPLRAIAPKATPKGTPLPANVTPMNEAQADDVCPVHNRAKTSNYGGVYCPMPDEDTQSGYCNWKKGGKSKAG